MHDHSVEMPGRYAGAIAVMQDMSWSWPDLCAAPADLVEELLWRIDRKAHWQAQRQRIDDARRRAKEAARAR